MGSWIRAISNEKPSLPVSAGMAAFCDFGSQENKSVHFSLREIINLEMFCL